MLRLLLSADADARLSSIFKTAGKPVLAADKQGKEGRVTISRSTISVRTGIVLGMLFVV